jgi:N-methylhydantoinase A/oxoprolinase/acetone carboxylase beta subunit
MPPAGEKGAEKRRYRLGFDIGGTFTDFVLIDSQSGHTFSYKALTTPANPAQAVLEGWRALLQQVQGGGEQIEAAIHGTTLLTNALIERKGAPTAVITTRGFRDALEIRREMRYDIYDLLIVLPEPLVPRSRRYEVAERVNARGEIVTPLDLIELDTLKAPLQRDGVRALAVCFLHAYANPVHEQQVGAWARGALPEVSVSISSEVAPQFREFERVSTTVCNAYVQPLAERYLSRLQTDLAREGFAHELYLMLSSGGITTLGTAIRFPVRLVESGPAAGALAAVFYGEAMSEPNLVSFDMGGTTAKICLIKDAQPAMTREFEIARVDRFKRGSGFPIQIPSIELIEIGAGGGSIAWIDSMGLLKVGPESAGADPGPACYGFGGTRPTVTDADLILGYLSPDYFLGGRMRLDRGAAEGAVQRYVGEPMGLGVVEAAHAIYQVVNENMLGATRVHVAERGADARRLLLMAFGGAGPTHAARIARALKMRGYVCPTSAGVASALGFLVAPAAFDFARSVVGTLTQEKLTELDETFAELEALGRATLADAAVLEPEMSFLRLADLRHVGQGHEIVVELPWPRLAAVDLEREMKPRFYSSYAELYGHAHPHLQVEITACRLRASGPRPRVILPPAPAGNRSADVALKGTRSAFFAERGGYVETLVYDRYGLPSGVSFPGPAIVEERDSTAVVVPDAVASVDQFSNLVVRFQDVP